MKLALVLLAAGCVSSTDDRGPWVPVESITGDFAPEVGPVPATITAPSLRIATWNVHFGADPDGLARAIQASQEVSKADVIIVQEIQAYPDEPGTRAHRLADALGMTWVYAPARYYDTGTHGIAVLSRFPLEAVAVRQLPYIDQPLHPENRIALAADVVVGEQRFRLVDVHLDVRIAPVDRIRQVHPAVNELGEPAPAGEPDRVVAGGDFNTNPWAWIDGIVPLTGTEAVIGQEQAAVVDDYMFGNGFAGAISPEQNTLRVPAFEFRCDDLYARGLSITASGVEHVDGSDHWPVWIDVVL